MILDKISVIKSYVSLCVFTVTLPGLFDELKPRRKSNPTVVVLIVAQKKTKKK